MILNAIGYKPETLFDLYTAPLGRVKFKFPSQTTSPNELTSIDVPPLPTVVIK